ncbi:hypothetical protein GCM10027063_01010 [Promicromonospora xylanilytica]
MGSLGGAGSDELGVESGTDPADHLKTEILGTLLDPVHGALARVQPFGELGLGQSTVLTGTTDQGSYLSGIHHGNRSGEWAVGAGDSHDDDCNSYVRYGHRWSPTSQ